MRLGAARCGRVRLGAAGCGRVRLDVKLVRARAGATGWATGRRGRMASTWTTRAMCGRPTRGQAGAEAAHELALFGEERDGIGFGADAGVWATPLRDRDVAVHRDVHRAGRFPRPAWAAPPIHTLGEMIRRDRLRLEAGAHPPHSLLALPALPALRDKKWTVLAHANVTMVTPGLRGSTRNESTAPRPRRY